jgi:ketoreductase RED2
VLSIALMNSSSDAPVALVTGSAQGIGAAVVRRLDAEGYRIVVNAERDDPAGRALAASMTSGIFVCADVSDERAVEMMVAEVDRVHGRLDLVVNNAGVGPVIPHTEIEAVDAALWQHVLGVNLIGPWWVSVHAAPLLRVSGDGQIVNITSLAAVRVGGSSIPYAVSKAGADHLTRLLAVALAPDIRVNGLAPGLVDTPRTVDWAAEREAVEQNSPLRRSAAPEDIADALMLLLGARHVTGEVLLVDGGAHLV